MIDKSKLPNGVVHELRRFYYDTAQAFNEYTLPTFTKVVPMSHILFGTDYPLEPIESTHNEMAKLRLPSDLQRAVDRLVRAGWEIDQQVDRPEKIVVRWFREPAAEGPS